MNNQGTAEWFNERIGKVTASRVADILATIKTGESASRANYRWQLVCERLTGLKEETYTNTSMETGTEREPLARAAYEHLKGVFVTEVGFIPHPNIEMAGASPDGIVEDGLIEIKCPGQNAHGQTLLSKKAPTKYIPQMQMQMASTNTNWCDFVSYNPTFPDHLQLVVVKVVRDPEYILNMEAEIIKFLAEVDETVELKYDGAA
jgi:putative phage-type endonuclease